MYEANDHSHYLVSIKAACKLFIAKARNLSLCM
jgi:hypothetical protein